MYKLPLVSEESIPTGAKTLSAAPTWTGTWTSTEHPGVHGKIDLILPDLATTSHNTIFNVETLIEYTYIEPHMISYLYDTSRKINHMFMSMIRDNIYGIQLVCNTGGGLNMYLESTEYDETSAISGTYMYGPIHDYGTFTINKI